MTLTFLIGHHRTYHRTTIVHATVHHTWLMYGLVCLGSFFWCLVMRQAIMVLRRPAGVLDFVKSQGCPFHICNPRAFNRMMSSLAHDLPCSFAGPLFYTNLTQGLPVSASVVSSGPKLMDFPRPRPHVLNPLVFERELDAWFGIGKGPTPYSPPVDTAYVLKIDQASVSGPLGDAVDSSGNVFVPCASEPRPDIALVASRLKAHTMNGVHTFDKLASLVHSYNYMHFHMLVETLPKAMQLKPLLDADKSIRLLVWGVPSTLEWLRLLLGVDESRFVIYNVDEVYTAKELYLPSPHKTGDMARELLDGVRDALHTAAGTAGAEEKSIVYVSRPEGYHRHVSNEMELLEAVRAAFPSDKLVVFDGTLSALEAVKTFRNAKVVLG